MESRASQTRKLSDESRTARMNVNALPEIETEDITVCSSNTRKYEESAADSGCESKKTMQDHLFGAAASGSLELLKFAGGVTLSTTGKLAAPPLMVTTKVILPALWEGLRELLKSFTPQRVKDWFEIVSASLYHFVDVLRNTHHGEIFRSRIAVVGTDLADCITSETSRQLIIDSMVMLIKLGEALHTPEFKSLLSQMNVVGIRIFDAAASGRNKQLFHDIGKAVWSFIQLSTDPSTIVALSEVTATLCHTLEMEDSVHRRKPSSQKRYQRNSFTRNVYNDRNLTNDRNSSIEQVIVSSLDGTLHTIDDPVDIPPKKDFTPEGKSQVSNESVKKSRTGSMYMEQKIQQRQNLVDQQRMLRTTISTEFDSSHNIEESTMKMQTASTAIRDEIEELVVETVLDDQLDKMTSTLTKSINMVESNVNKQTLIYENETKLDKNYVSSNEDDKPTSTIKNTKTAASPESKPSTLTQFYDKLDEIMREKRCIGLNEYIKYKKPSEFLASKGSFRNQRHGRSTIKSVLNDVRRGFWEGDNGAMEMLKDKQNQSFPKDFFVSKIALLFFAFIIIFWFTFGCYGIFIYLRSYEASSSLDSTKPKPLLQNTGIVENEIVIRVVREVRHVDQSGKQFYPEGVFDDNNMNDVDREKIANCLAETFR